MKKNIYFFSDVHFGLHEDKTEKIKEAHLLDFLNHVKKNGSELFILGDLFDFWFEYEHVIPRGYEKVLSKLNELVEGGIKVHYILGNHDFWMRDYFQKDLGIKVYREPIEINRGGKKIFLHHGDGLALNDLGYKLLKIVFRSKFTIWLFSLLHPDFAARLGKYFSRSSRNHTSTKNYGEADGMLQFAEKKISSGVDFVLMGHRHNSLNHKFLNGTYINLGDWITERTFAVFNGKNFQLKKWK